MPVRIVLIFGELLQVQRLALFTPTVHCWLAYATPPNLIRIADLPAVLEGQFDQHVPPFLSGGTRVQGW
jgi:hypothetical protein